MGVKKHPQQLSANRVRDAIERRHEAEVLDWIERGWSLFSGQDATAPGYGWDRDHNALGLMAYFGGWDCFLAKYEAKIRSQADFNPDQAFGRRSSSEAASPLHFAARRGDASLCQLLIRWGADANRLGRLQRQAYGRDDSRPRPPLALADSPGAALALLGGGARESLCEGPSEGLAGWIKNSAWTLDQLQRAHDGCDAPLRAPSGDARQKRVLASALDYASGARLRLVKEWGATNEDFLRAAGGPEKLTLWMAHCVLGRKLDALRAGSEIFSQKDWLSSWGFSLDSSEAKKHYWLKNAISALRVEFADKASAVTPWALCALPDAGHSVAAVAVAAGFSPSEMERDEKGRPRSGWATLISMAERLAKNNMRTDPALPLWIAGQKGFDPSEKDSAGVSLGVALLNQAARASSDTQENSLDLLRVMQRLAKANWAPNAPADVWKTAFDSASSDAGEWSLFEQAIAQGQANALGSVAKAVKMERRNKRRETGEKTPPSPKAKARRL